MANNQKSIIKISLDKEKLSAVKTFLERKNLKLEEEFEQFFDMLFKKHVPKDVQIYIESMTSSSKKSGKKPSVRTDKSLADTDKMENRNPANETTIQAESTPVLPSIPNRFDRFKD